MNPLTKLNRCIMPTDQLSHKKDIRVHVRWMIRIDMPEVLRIESASFEYPWDEQDFLDCLKHRNCIGMVAERGESVVGFMIYEMHNHHLEFLNFAVDPTHRRCGVGTQMLLKLIGKLSTHRRTRILLNVRDSNLPAQLFFSRLYFKAIEVQRNYYNDSGEDAYLMEYRLPDVISTEDDDWANNWCNGD